MKRRKVSVRRLAAGLAAFAGGGYLLAGPGTSCGSYIGQSALVASDFCFIFDCQNGLFGGTVNPCSGIGSGSQTVEGTTRPPLFADCPTNNTP
ncbi:MAG: hypothetical protein AABZ12_10845 [Planctomycetota bacterium]